MSLIRSLTLITLASSLMLASCLETNSADGDSARPPDDIPAPGDSDGVSCWYSGSEDSDSDGILDITEDANRNCFVDAEETDPRIADSDGDGLVDGDEDVDANGVWDAHRGEFNPRVYDTAGDGVADGLKPRSRVCNRQHFASLKGERMILASGLTLYAHSDIQWVEPAGERSVFLRGEARFDFGTIIDVTASALSMDSAIAAMTRIIAQRTSVDYLGRRWMASVGQEAVQLRIESSQALEAAFAEIIGAIDPSALSFVPNSVEGVHGTDSAIILQIVRLESDGKVRFSIGASAENTDSEWLNVVHPRLMAPDSSHTIRLYCEDVEEVETDSLDIFVLLESGVAPDRYEIWDAVTRYVIGARNDRGLATRLFVPNAEGNGQWLGLDLGSALADGWMDSVLSVGADEMFSVTGPYLSSIAAHTDATRAQLLLMVTGTGEGNARVSSTGTSELLSGLPNLSMVTVAPSPAPYGCAENALSDRFESIEAFSRNSDAYLISSCGFQGQYESARKIVAPFVEHMWRGGQNRPLWHTLRLATEDGAVDAEFTMLGSQQVVVSRGASGFAQSAISYGVWEPSLLSAIRPSP